MGCTEHDDEDSDGTDGEDEAAPRQPLSGDRNSQLMVGYKGDRSYVVRGNNIGVFNQNSNDHSVKYYATIANVATPKGKSFKPKHVGSPYPDVTMQADRCLGYAP